MSPEQTFLCLLAAVIAGGAGWMVAVFMGAKWLDRNLTTVDVDRIESLLMQQFNNAIQEASMDDDEEDDDDGLEQGTCDCST